MSYPLVSLFAGIGGLDLGLESTGYFHAHTQVEIEPYCRAVLARRWPNARRHDDVRTFNPASIPPDSVICGGFPCQDISVAGKGAGLDGARSGLWYEFARIIAESRPVGVVIENSPRLERLGLDVIVEFLTDQGYQVEATRLNASDVGAPHRRQRLFVIAWRAVGDAHSQGELQQSDPKPQGRGRTSHAGGTVADASGLGRSERDLGQRGQAGPTSAGARAGASECRVGGDSHGIPRRLDRRWPAGRGVDQHPWEPSRTVPARSQANRKARVKALGNAVVPAVAAIVGERLAHHLNNNV